MELEPRRIKMCPLCLTAYADDDMHCLRQCDVPEDAPRRKGRRLVWRKRLVADCYCHYPVDFKPDDDYVHECVNW